MGGEGGVCGGDAVGGVGVIEKPYEKGYGAGDVYEGVDSVDPCHCEGSSQEKGLDVEFPENVEVSLEGYYLKSVIARCVNGSFDYEDC